MLGSQHPDKSAVGRKRTDSASASITEKSNLQLLNEVEAMLSLPAEEMDTDRIEEYLSLLQKRAPVAEHYDPEEKWAKLEESHPLIFEEEPNSCKSDLAAEARNRHDGGGWAGRFSERKGTAVVTKKWVLFTQLPPVYNKKKGGFTHERRRENGRDHA